MAQFSLAAIEQRQRIEKNDKQPTDGNTVFRTDSRNIIKWKESIHESKLNPIVYQIRDLKAIFIKLFRAVTK
uniref:Uncharacterized protein n=1 Tax=Tetranychus urticae TaxID=32264 RepID=T1JYN7_TETUR